MYWNALRHITCTWTCRFVDQSTSSLCQSKQVFDWYSFVLEASQQLLIRECFNDIYKQKNIASLFLAFAFCSHCGSATRATIVRRTCCTVTEKSYAEEHCSEEHQPGISVGNKNTDFRKKNHQNLPTRNTPSRRAQ